MKKILLTVLFLICFALTAVGGDFSKSMSPQEVTKFRKYIKEYILLSTPDLTSEEFDKMSDVFYSDYEEDGLIFNLALQHNETDIVRRMLEMNPELANGIMFSGESSLDIAVMSGSYEVAELLIKNGANVNSVFDGQITPILSAACTGSIKMTKLLVENGANVNFRDYAGSSVLDIVLNNYDEDDKIVQYLKSAGAKSSKELNMTANSFEGD